MNPPPAGTEHTARPPEVWVDRMTDLVGTTFGPGEWLLVDQALIDEFGRLTGDLGWYHVDTDRAREELPGGRTIAHGLLTMAVLPKLAASVMTLRFPGRGLTYGYDTVRFVEPVLEGARIRLRREVLQVESVARGSRLRFLDTVEIEGASKPAVSAVQIVLALPQE